MGFIVGPQCSFVLAKATDLAFSRRLGIMKALKEGRVLGGREQPRSEQALHNLQLITQIESWFIDAGVEILPIQVPVPPAASDDTVDSSYSVF